MRVARYVFFSEQTVPSNEEKPAFHVNLQHFLSKAVCYEIQQPPVSHSLWALGSTQHYRKHRFTSQLGNTEPSTNGQTV